VSLAIAYSVHGPSRELRTPRGRSEAGRVEGAQAFRVLDWRLPWITLSSGRCSFTYHDQPSCRATANIVWASDCVAFPKQGETDAAGKSFAEHSGLGCLLGQHGLILTAEKLKFEDPREQFRASPLDSVHLRLHF
jgi:hypothetical protein